MVESRAYDAGRGIRAGRRRAAGDGSSVWGGGLDCRLGAGHGEERTENMLPMLVTLEVSKLSGRLNATAPCRESKGGHTMLDMVRAGRQEAEGVRGVSLGARARSERTWNICNMFVTPEVCQLEMSALKFFKL